MTRERPTNDPWASPGQALGDPPDNRADHPQNLQNGHPKLSPTGGGRPPNGGYGVMEGGAG
jgi:hypothetical protein